MATASRSREGRFRVRERASMSIFGPPPDDPYIRAALLRALRDAPPFVPRPRPLWSAARGRTRQARELRETGRLN